MSPVDKAMLDRLSARYPNAFQRLADSEKSKDPQPEPRERQTPMQVLVFGAPWCASCQVLKKQLEGQSFTGFEIIHVNMDVEPELAIKYGIKSLPSVVIPEKQFVRTGNISTLRQFQALLGSI